MSPQDHEIAETGAAILGIAFLVKAGGWPLNFWLPRAYQAAGAPIAAMFAITTKVGVYAILRASSLLEDATTPAPRWPVVVLPGARDDGIAASPACSRRGSFRARGIRGDPLVRHHPRGRRLGRARDDGARAVLHGRFDIRHRRVLPAHRHGRSHARRRRFPTWRTSHRLRLPTRHSMWASRTDPYSPDDEVGAPFPRRWRFWAWHSSAAR